MESNTKLKCAYSRLRSDASSLRNTLADAPRDRYGFPGHELGTLLVTMAEEIEKLKARIDELEKAE